MAVFARSMTRSSVLKSATRTSISLSPSTRLSLSAISVIPSNSTSSISVSTRRLFATATATDSKPKRASTTTTKKLTTTKPKKKPVVKKKVVKPKVKAAPKPKKEKLKPWQARGADGKLLPLPSASKPTRRTSFLLFMAEKMPAAKASGNYLKKSPKTGNEVLDIAAVAKAMGSEWRELSASEKQRYDELAEVEKASYERALADWTSALSSEDIRRQNAYVTAQKKAGKRMIGGKIFDSNKPKKPQTAFFLFLSDYRKRNDSSNSGLKVTEIVKHASQEWQGLSKEEKEEWEKKTEGPLRQYKLDLEEYKRSQS